MRKKASVFDCGIINLGKKSFAEGNLTVVENENGLPFKVNRVFYLFDIAAGESRGAHAHKDCHQLLIAASGSFEVNLDDGKFKRQVFLNRPDLGLHIPPGVWASEVNFSSGAICLVLASHCYDEKDYIRNYNEYKLFRNEQNVQLVNFDEIFLEKSWEWLNEPELKHLTDTGDFTKEEQKKWFDSLAKKEDYKIWGVKLDDQPIGVFGIKNINEQGGEYWGYIGEKEMWGKGYGASIMDAIIEKAKKLKLPTLTLKVIAENERAIKLYEKMGFEPVGDEDKFKKMKRNI